MKTRDEDQLLMEQIIVLRNRQAYELQLLKRQVEITFESLQPLNLIKNAFHDVTSSPEIRNDLIHSAVSLTTGYLTRNLFFGTFSRPIQKMVGSALQFFFKKSETRKNSYQEIE